MKHRVGLGGRVPNGVHKKKAPKNRYRFTDEKIVIKKTGAIAYLRGRYDVVKQSVRFSIRNQRNGGGRELVNVDAVPIANAGVGLDRIHSKVAFDYVVYAPYMEFKAKERK